MSTADGGKKGAAGRKRKASAAGASFNLGPILQMDIPIPSHPPVRLLMHIGNALSA